jgi:hypothetical protein
MIPKLFELMKEYKPIEDRNSRKRKMRQESKGENPLQMQDGKELCNSGNRTPKSFQLTRGYKCVQEIIVVLWIVDFDHTPWTGK